jgi:hypothetical protein
MANLDPNLLLFVSGARWQSKVGASNNYFVTIIQRGGWSFGSKFCSGDGLQHRNGKLQV